jgi:HSP20 family protein
MMATRTMHTDPFHSLRPMREPDPEWATNGSPTFQPLAYDVYREAGTLVLEFDIPGIDPGDVEVAVEDRHVVVTVRRETALGAGVDLIERGRPHGSFSRRLLLGASWDLEHLQASTRHGVLRLEAPHLAERVRRTVRVGDDETSDEQGWSFDGTNPRVAERVAPLDGHAAVHSAA